MSAVTKQINVTDLTPSQKRDLFVSYITQAGFTGFIKKKIGEQTYYTFTYKN
jgi:hypothetical protein